MLEATRAEGMKMQIEIRRATAAPETEGVVLVGIAVPYNEYTEIHEHGVTFRERFLPGSMEIPESATLKLGHEPGGVPLARAGAGTIEFDPDDPRGLAFRASLPESRRDIVEALERGDLSGAVSVGFYDVEDEKRLMKSGRVAYTRDIRRAKLDHLAILDTAPAYAGAKGEIQK